jgi:hypothetical protein
MRHSPRILKMAGGKQYESLLILRWVRDANAQQRRWRHAETMHTVGPRPLMWHVMRYYTHFGYKEFILCLG